jgi:hypothetical protein
VPSPRPGRGAQELSEQRKILCRREVEKAMRGMQVCLFVALSCLQSAAVPANEPFSVRILQIAPEAPLGVHPSLTIEVRNTSGKAQPMPFMRARAGVRLLTTPEQTGTGGQPERERVEEIGVFTSREEAMSMEVDSDWVFRSRIWVPVHTPGKYTVRAFFSVEPGATKHIGEPEDHWAGKVSSRSVEVRCCEPSGVDTDAFKHLVDQSSGEAGSRLVSYSKAFLLGDARGELFRRFPESTYTAYQVYEHYARFRPWEDTSTILAILGMELSRFHNSVPCDNEECAGSGAVRLRGKDYLSWQVKWFERVLKHHPGIWFADDLRFHMALDHLLLGEKAQGAHELETLAENERSVWASRSRELLQRLRESNMIQ